MDTPYTEYKERSFFLTSTDCDVRPASQHASSSPLEGLQYTHTQQLSCPGIAQQCGIFRTKTNDSFFQPTASKSKPCSKSCRQGTSLSPSSRRRVDLKLPSFGDLDLYLSTPNLTRTQTSISAPLTPPPDELESARNSILSDTICSQDSDTPILSSRDSHTSSPNLAHGVLARRAMASSLQSSIVLPDQATFEDSPWVVRASRTILAQMSNLSGMQQLQIVSHTLPSQAKDSRTKPTFEEVLESAQLQMGSSPFITITHAVPQARTMQELPKTPPSTPGARPDAHDYFGSDQTIFTHAAVVPIYHDHGPPAQSTQRIPHFIAAPHSVQISILERYIPPTMPAEVADFFSSSSRSYLSDRLHEISPNNGSLILVYPTKTGGRTFARNYLGPVIDPLLRQFVLLNGLTTDAAGALGTMAAVDHMLEYEDMERQVKQLCQLMSQRPGPRGRQTVYRITFCEKSHVTLARSDWLNWYIEQEQSRLRQNLVDYHHAGGRMPEGIGHKEVTVGMLTRQIVAGLQKSSVASGGTDIEIGTFVITSCGI